jgi:hypothetical protein
MDCATVEPLFAQLYKDEKRPLKVVMSEVEENYGSMAE